MADGHGRTRSKLVIRVLALGILAALAAGAALAADRGKCGYVGYDGYAGPNRCDKRALPVIDSDTPTGRKDGKLKLSAARAGNAEQVVWDFDGDGFDDAAGQLAPEVPLSAAGSRTIGLRVTDPHGRSAEAEKTFGVHEGNAAPDLQVYPEQGEVGAGEVYMLGWLVRDADDANVTVTVDYGDGTIETYPTSEYEEADHRYASAGVKTLKVSVSDGQHTTSTTFTARIGATPGAADPRAYSFDVNTPRAGRLTTLTQYAFDPDDELSPLNFAWDLDGDGDYDDGAGPFVSHTFAGGAPATYGVRITDSNGGVTTVRNTVVPTAFNVEPEASLFVDPIEPRAGVPVTIYGYGHDFDSDELVELSYDLDDDGQFDDKGDVDEFEHTFTTLGKHSIAVKAVDADGGWSIHRGDIVVATAAPTAEFAWSPRRPDPGTPVTFTGTGEDPDGTDVELEWDLDGDVVWDDQTGSSASKTFPAKGWQPVSLRVTDEDGDVRVVTHYIPVGDVINHNPKASFSVSPAAPRAGQAVTFTSTSTDPDGDPITDYFWEVDGDEDYDDGSFATTAYTYAAAGTYDVYLYVEDNRGGWDEVTGKVTVGAPQAGGGGGGGNLSPVPDTTAPTLTVNAIGKKALKLATVRSKGLKVPVGCSESCTATLELRADKKTAKKLKLGKKAVVLGKASGQVAANGTLTVKLTAKAKKALKKAKTVKLTLSGTARDAAGNTSALAPKTLTLKK